MNQSVTFNRGHTSGDTACVNHTVKHVMVIIKRRKLSLLSQAYLHNDAEIQRYTCSSLKLTCTVVQVCVTFVFWWHRS